ncbi:MAG: hypothetical protein IT536_03160 [Hyphomicrobiales bacterium]|nr:hypothetical protein [Hyphomicrobiales bacterium]
MLPLIGAGVSVTQGLLSGFCLISKGDYQEGLKRIAWVLGKRKFDHLVEQYMIKALHEGRWSVALARYLGHAPHWPKPRTSRKC